MHYKLNETSFFQIFIKVVSYLFALVFFALGIFGFFDNTAGLKEYFIINIAYLIVGFALAYNGFKVKIKYFYLTIDDNGLEYFFEEGINSIPFSEIEALEISGDYLLIKQKNKSIKQINLKNIKKHLSYKEKQTLEKKLIELKNKKF